MKCRTTGALQKPDSIIQVDLFVSLGAAGVAGKKQSTFLFNLMDDLMALLSAEIP
jgi:hypothetical protein